MMRRNETVRYTEINITNNKLSIVALGYIQKLTNKPTIIRKSIVDLILKYYLTLTYESCWDITYDKINISSHDISLFLTKLSTRQYAPNETWCSHIINTFQSFDHPKFNYKSRHYKLYLTFMTDLLSFFMHNVNTDNVAVLLQFLKGKILLKKYYQGTECHKICSKFIAKMLNIHLFNLSEKNRLKIHKALFLMDKPNKRQTQDFDPLSGFIHIIKSFDGDKAILSELLGTLVQQFFHDLHIYSIEDLYHMMADDESDRALGLVIIMQLMTQNEFAEGLKENGGHRILSSIMNTVVTEWTEYMKTETNHAFMLKRMCSVDNVNLSFECIYKLLSSHIIKVDIEQYHHTQFITFLNKNWLNNKYSGIGDRQYYAFKILDEYLKIDLGNGLDIFNNQRSIYESAIATKVAMIRDVRHYKRRYRRMDEKSEYRDYYHPLYKRMFIIEISVALKLQKAGKLSDINMKEIDIFVEEIQGTKLFKRLGVLNEFVFE